MFRSKARRYGLAKPMPSMVRALAFSAAFSLVVWLSGMNPVISSDQIELNLEPVHPPSETLDLETKPEKQWSPKAMVAPVLDKVAAIKVDSDTEDEYWVFDQLPFKNFKLRILRKETSMLEVLISGFLAGFVVELTNALLLHPIDTFKTRLQRGSGVVTPDPSLLYQRLFDGLGPVLATVLNHLRVSSPTFQMFQDIVRKSLILLVRAKLPAPVADVVSSTFASACGEAVFLAVKTPGQVLKIELQAAVLEEDAVRQRFSDEDTSYSSRCSELDPYALWEDMPSYPKARGNFLSSKVLSKRGSVALCTPADQTAGIRYLRNQTNDRMPPQAMQPSGEPPQLPHPVHSGCASSGDAHRGVRGFA
eukprot:g17866.t1